MQKKSEKMDRTKNIREWSAEHIKHRNILQWTVKAISMNLSHIWSFRNLNNVNISRIDVR